MDCCKKKVITVYKGYPSSFMGFSLLHIRVNSQASIDGFKLKFIVGDIVKTYPITEDEIQVNLTAEETERLKTGLNNASIVIIDRHDRERPFTTALPIMVKQYVQGDIELDEFDVTLTTEIEENTLEINIKTEGSVSDERILELIGQHNVSEDAHDNRFTTKVDKTSDASKVYGTDKDGEQTTYDVESFGKVDDVKVGDTSVVQNKIATLGTMAGETASNYRKSADQDTIDSGINKKITDHIADKDNPHEVSKSQVGLSNVQNVDTTNASNISSGTLSNDRLGTIPYSKLSGVQATITDLDEIREGASKGATAIQNTDDCVHIAGYEEITGSKTFKANPKISSNWNIVGLSIQNTNITKGGSFYEQYNSIDFLSGNGSTWKDRTGMIENRVNVGSSDIRIMAYNPNKTTPTESDIAELKVSMSNSGVASAHAPAPTEDTTTSTQIDTVGARNKKLETKQDKIDDIATIRSNAQAGKSASDTISTYGNIVTHNVGEFATSEQGVKADTAVQNSLKLITLGD